MASSFRKPLLCLTLIAAATACKAQERLYAGAALGLTSLKIDCAGTTECDTHDSGPKVYVGLNLSPELALEAGYQKFGKASFRTPLGAGDGKAEALFAAIALRYAFVPEFSGVLRLGAAAVKSSGVITTSGGSVASSSTDLRPYWGLGLAYRVDKHWSAVAAADFTKGTEVAGVKANVQMYSVGAQLGF